MSDEGTSTTPAPVAPLEYSYMTNRGRPGILTAVGVMSIVVASISALASLYSGLSAFGYYKASRMPATAFTTPAMPATTGPTTAPAGTTSVTLQTYNATAWSVVPGPGGGATTLPTTMPAPAPVLMGNPFAGISRLAVILSAVAAVLGLGLAIYLLIAGIQVLRDSPGGAKLHWWYAVLKIPLVIFAFSVGLWLSLSMISGMMAAMPAGPAAMMSFQRTFTVMWAVLTACLSLAYPIALIFVLRGKLVRAYYNTVRG